MKDLKRDLEKLRKIEKRKKHPLSHEIHKKYNITKKTLFYVKEYGSHSNVLKTILKESLKIVLFASILSSVGGFALEQIKSTFISITPLIILLPVLNSMVGNYGIIISSRFSTLLYTGKLKGKWRKSSDLKHLIVQMSIISIIMAVISASLSLAISYFSSYPISLLLSIKIFTIVILNVVFLVGILFLISIAAGLHYYEKGEDPDNFLIPITTSIADFGSMLLLGIFILWMF